MLTVRYTADGGSYRDLDGDRADPDDRELEVSEEKAETLVEEFDFERVEDTPGSGGSVEGTVNVDDSLEPPASSEFEDDESDDDICGAEMSDDSTCERPAGECPYHGDEED